MKIPLLFVLAIVLPVGFVASENLECNAGTATIEAAWKSMTDNCTLSMYYQIQKEVDASIQYLAMGAYFSKDTVNLPGFAEHFFKAASEEREHAQKLIEYLLMRGGLNSKHKKLEDMIIVNVPKQLTWTNGKHALDEALKLEVTVTNSIRQVIQQCEKDPLVKPEDEHTNNDFHLVDYLTGEFLEEQFKGQRELVHLIASLGKMMDTHGELGQFLFDKKLLD
ncbi:Ferritin [Sergentomyia squamirostris]